MVLIRRKASILTLKAFQAVKRKKPSVAKQRVLAERKKVSHK